MKKYHAASLPTYRPEPSPEISVELLSTILREINRNSGMSKYRAVLADRQAWNRAKRPKSCQLSDNVRLRNSVSDKLASKWSPEQIAGWLKQRYPKPSTPE